EVHARALELSRLQQRCNLSGRPPGSTLEGMPIRFPSSFLLPPTREPAEDSPMIHLPRLRKSAVRASRPAVRRCRPQLEVLEERNLLSAPGLELTLGTPLETPPILVNRVNPTILVPLPAPSVPPPAPSAPPSVPGPPIVHSNCGRILTDLEQP